jgi:DNA-binding MarR family transcriptional regulator
MDKFDSELNEILVDTFKSILKIEELSLKYQGLKDLSINEMHLLEEVGKSGDGGVTVGDLAQKLGITPPSVTAAINKLEKKGYVNKNRCNNDGRVVYVSLTKLGKKIDSVHRYFHRQMIRNISGELNEEEKAILYKGIVGLNEFFKNKAKQFRE